MDLLFYFIWFRMKKLYVWSQNNIIKKQQAHPLAKVLCLSTPK